MGFSSRKNKAVILIIGILAILFSNLFQKEIRGFVYSFSKPVQRIFWQEGQKISYYFETISEISNLKKNNEELKSRNQELTSENTALRELKKENETLREALNINLQRDFKLEIAQVIGKDISQDSFFLDKGGEDGISEGLPVISQSKILLGRIGKVYKNNSELILVSNQKSNISVKVGDGELGGIVKGKGNFQIILDLIPLDKEMKPGDAVTTNGMEGNLPRDLLIGKVNKILRNDIQPHQGAEIEPALDFNKIDSVFIIINY
jgi:rod shape-determining protein MreC